MKHFVFDSFDAVSKVVFEAESCVASVICSLPPRPRFPFGLGVDRVGSTSKEFQNRCPLPSWMRWFRGSESGFRLPAVVQLLLQVTRVLVALEVRPVLLVRQEALCLEERRGEELRCHDDVAVPVDDGQSTSNLLKPFPAWSEFAETELSQ